jgi:Calcineurin-like phosphoesterase
VAVPHVSPTGHRFGRPRRLATDPPLSAGPAAQPFQPLPPAPGTYPYHLSLESIIGAPATNTIIQAGVLDFHTMGDTGGINNPTPQLDVAAALEADLKPAPPGGFDPSFLYLLGDCIYFNGEESNYFAQFYDPYTHYTRPILAVPGNHDGEPLPPGQTTLDGFLQNFCTTTPQVNPQSRSSARTTMTQPNVYWTLEAPFVTIVGLYTNISETDGQLDQVQITWLDNELATAPANKALMVTMHHPPVSADDHYGSATNMFQILDAAITKTGRAPDMILAGHVHNYQRFTRTLTIGKNTRQIPYVVAGAGGYHNLHLVAADAAAATLPWRMPAPPNTTLDAFEDTRYGFARVRVDNHQIRFQFLAVAPSPGVAPTSVTPALVDSFALDLTTSTVGPAAAKRALPAKKSLAKRRR